MSVPCYKGKHLAFALILGVPGIILFCLGIPILSAFFLRMRKGLLNDPEFSLRFGFLYEGTTAQERERAVKLWTRCPRVVSMWVWVCGSLLKMRGASPYTLVMKGQLNDDHF